LDGIVTRKMGKRKQISSLLENRMNKRAQIKYKHKAKVLSSHSTKKKTKKKKKNESYLIEPTQIESDNDIIYNSPNVPKNKHLEVIDLLTPPNDDKNDERKETCHP